MDFDYESIYKRECESMLQRRVTIKGIIRKRRKRRKIKKKKTVPNFLLTELKVITRSCKAAPGPTPYAKRCPWPC